MMWKLITLLPCAATVLTLAIIPKAQAAEFVPTPTVIETAPSDNKLDTINDGISALFVENVVVETVQDQLSTVYNVCFEYGNYDDIFTTNRPDICENSANGPLAFRSTPTFLTGNNLLAQRAAGGPTGGPSPNGTIPTSDGLLTALNNAITNDPLTSVYRTQGDIIADDGMGMITNFGPIDLLSAYIPYAADANNISVLRVRYNDLDGEWGVDGLNSTITIPRDELDPNSFVMFARFEQIDTIPLDDQPPQPGVPEPSGVMGIFLAGVSMFATVRRR